jgi:hypothetical protein
MIKNWKLFLEAFDPFQGDPFREEILGNVDDILSPLKDNGFYIDIVYGFSSIINNKLLINIKGKEFPFRQDGIESLFISSDDFQSIIHLNSYLISEEFEPISDNILKELSCNFAIKFLRAKPLKSKMKTMSYPISRLEYSLKKSDMKINFINFEYRLPKFAKLFR